MTITGPDPSGLSQPAETASASSDSGMVVVFPDPAPVDIGRVLDFGGFQWRAVEDELALLNLLRSEGSVGVSAAIVGLEDRMADGLAILELLRQRPESVAFTLVTVRGNQLDEVSGIVDSFDDFCISPFHPAEAEARIRHGMTRGRRSPIDVAVQRIDLDDGLVVYSDLSLNLETYQAHVRDRPLDLTYMEYELLRFLVASPGKVFSREVLLAQVWGYEYFGGARTVDVHIRRLRAKLGEEYAGLIQTVRSVGYRFGDARSLVA